MYLSDVIATISLFLIFYAYAGYPFVLWIWGTLYPTKIIRRTLKLPVSVIISAYNEEAFIVRCLQSILNSDYPVDKLLEVIVASESIDRTNALVLSLQDTRVCLMAENHRTGKKAALDRAAQSAKGDILVFADANSVFLKDTIRQLVSNFADLRLGSVCGTRKIIPTQSSMARGDGLYWRYEGKLRDLESRTGCCYSGCDGILYAVRKQCFKQKFPGNLNEDVAMCYRLFEEGYSNRYDLSSNIYEPASQDSGDEFIRKTRIVARNIRTSWHFRHLYNPWRYPGFFIQNISHRIIRWSVPFFLIVLLLSSWASHQPFFHKLSVLQILFYVLAWIGSQLELRKLPKFISWVVSIPLYFTTVNLAALWGWIMACQREGNAWQRVQRDHA